MLAVHVLNFGRAKWLEDMILQYSAQVRHTQEYLLYSLVLINKIGIRTYSFRTIITVNQVAPERLYSHE